MKNRKDHLFQKKFMEASETGAAGSFSLKLNENKSKNQTKQPGPWPGGRSRLKRAYRPGWVRSQVLPAQWGRGQSPLIKKTPNNRPSPVDAARFLKTGTRSERLHLPPSTKPAIPSWRCSLPQDRDPFQNDFTYHLRPSCESQQTCCGEQYRPRSREEPSVWRGIYLIPRLNGNIPGF
jgi:hypothetical protein